jgi:LysM repeat protein
VATPVPITPAQTTEADPDTSAGETGIGAPAVPTPQHYVVEGGDTLSGIAAAYGVTIDELVEFNRLADPDMLQVGQELLIPAASTAPASLASSEEPVAATVDSGDTVLVSAKTPPPTPTSSGPPLIEIAQVIGSGTLDDEYVVIRNRGGFVSLEHWILSDGRGGSYTFPSVILYTGADLRLHSRSGADRPGDLHWGLVEPAWEGGQLLTLRDALGEVVDTYIAP